MTELADMYPAGRVVLREVGLRDGLQLVKTWPSTAAKRDWILAEHAAGVRHFEVGSFLPAERMPQFADVREIVATVAALPDAFGVALALNERGASDALLTGVDEICCVVSASEAHNLANARRTRAQSLAELARVVDLRRQSNRRPLINVGIAMAFGCSLTGEVAADEVLRLAESCLEAGADLVGIADTVGYAGPRQVGQMAAALTRLCGERPYVVHLHDTRGMALANASAALDAGARVLDGSLGGLGGCPFAPGASGNAVFEDLVFLGESKGFATGIALEKLLPVRGILERAMPGEGLQGALARAGLPKATAWRA